MTELFGCTHNPEQRRIDLNISFSGNQRRPVEYCGVCGAVFHEVKEAS